MKQTKRQIKKAANKKTNKSELTVKQNIKRKKGPKPGEVIKGVFRNRKVLERACLELYLSGDLGVNSEYGTATLCRFLAELEILYSKSGKPLSYNTIREDITEIKKEMLYETSYKK